jgi:hypothetical protein
MPPETTAGREVVIMHTADMLTRPPADLGDLVSLPDPLPGSDHPRWMDLVAAGAGYVWRVPDAPTFRRTVGLDRTSIDPQLDFPRQGKPMRPLERRRPPLDPDLVDAAKVEELVRMAAWCRARGLRAWYCHGPLDAEWTGDSQAYFDRVNAIIADAGFGLVNRYPLGLGPAAVGDTEDHVHPDFKAASTAWYAERIREARAGTPPYANLDIIGGEAAGSP